MKYLNPIFWYTALKEYPFAVWTVSGIQTWIEAFVFSWAYPPWAQDMMKEVWPVIKDFAVAGWDVVRELFTTS